VIENYRNTPEARNAVNGLRNAYTDMDDVESFFAYMKNVEGMGDIEASTRDSMLYISGENQYIKGNCEGRPNFQELLGEFPSGSFAQMQGSPADCLNRSERAIKPLKCSSGYQRGNNQFMGVNARAHP
jgi:hypothetical protein